MGLSSAYGERPHDEAVAIIRAAFEGGVTLFDTAEAYGPFVSESLLGEAVEAFRDQVVIATKFGFGIDPDTGARTGGLNSRPDHIKAVVEAQLKRLRTDRDDLLYQHRGRSSRPDGGRRRGGEGPDRRRQDPAFRPFGTELGLLAPRPRGSAGGGPAERILPVDARCGGERDPGRLRGTGDRVRSFDPLGAGFLTGKIDETTTLAASDFRSISPRFAADARAANMALVNLLKAIAEAKQATAAQVALSWLLARKPWIVPIPGTTKPRRLAENLGAAQVDLTAGDLDAIQKAASQITIQGRACPRPSWPRPAARGRRPCVTRRPAAWVAAISWRSAWPCRPSRPKALRRAPGPSSRARAASGELEVSSIGLGVQNMSRTYQTTVPSRPEMINIIRAAHDRGVTLFDTAEAWSPRGREESSAKAWRRSGTRW